jgi:hypothetical protein
MRHKILFISGILIFMNLAFAYGQIDQSRQWPSYRGFQLSGVLDKAGLPESFDINTGKNIKWKIEIPGLSLSSPVIWGNDLFITTAISETDKSGFKPGIYGSVDPVNDASVH